MEQCGWANMEMMIERGTCTTSDSRSGPVRVTLLVLTTITTATAKSTTCRPILAPVESNESIPHYMADEFVWPEARHRKHRGLVCIRSWLGLAEPGSFLLILCSIQHMATDATMMEQPTFHSPTPDIRQH